MASVINATTTNGIAIQPDNSGIVQLQSNNTATVTVNTAGNVGIGTTSPSFVTGSGLIVERSGNSAAVEVKRTDAATAGSLTLLTGNTLHGLHGSGVKDIAFYTNAIERMRIDSSGNVLFGTTTPTGTSNVGASFEPNTNSRSILFLGTSTTSGNTLVSFRNPNGQVGTITVSGSGTTYNTSSDYRLKEDVAPMTGALDKVALLKPVTYKWKVDGSDGQGFIAHELQEVVPECVSGEKDAVDAEGNPEYQGVDTSFLVATLTAAIQEQQTIINDLKARIETLEAK
jgi:hypothetical protein